MGDSVAEIIVRKAKEPSTWKGIGWILAAAGLVPVESVDLVVSAGVGMVGLVEVLRKESK